MTYVNHEDIDIASEYVVRDHSRCCCKPHYSAAKCVACRPTTQICCMQMTHSDWPTVKGYFVRETHTFPPWIPGTLPTWMPDEACDDKGMTNLCGELRLVWRNVVHLDCLRVDKLRWLVTDDCKKVRIGLVDGGSYGLAETREVDRDWYLSPLVFDDPYYLFKRTEDPDAYPLPAPTITIEPCPVPTPMFFDGVDDQEIYLKGWLQSKVGDEWVTYSGSGGIAFGKGNCVTGQPFFCTGKDPSQQGIRWCYNLTNDKITVSVDGTYDGVKEVGYADCTWEDSVIIVEHHSPPSGAVGWRWYIERITDCDDEGGGPPGGCDPGCWPPCIICPNPVDLYFMLDVVGCCLSDVYTLTYNESGASGPGFYGGGTCYVSPSLSHAIRIELTCTGLLVDFADITSFGASWHTEVSGAVSLSCSGGELVPITGEVNDTDCGDGDGEWALYQ